MLQTHTGDNAMLHYYEGELDRIDGFIARGQHVAHFQSLRPYYVQCVEEERLAAGERAIAAYHALIADAAADSPHIAPCHDDTDADDDVEIDLP